MNLIEKQNDGNNREQDKQIIAAKMKENTKFNVFIHSYCFLVSSGYIPKKWVGFKIPEKDYINITISNKRLN